MIQIKNIWQHPVTTACGLVFIIFGLALVWMGKFNWNDTIPLFTFALGVMGLMAKDTPDHNDTGGGTSGNTPATT